jgi:hypothetical protein
MRGDAEVEAVIEPGDGTAAPAVVRRLIFVSHASPQDNIFATWLATQLAIAGYEVWCDTTKLLAGERFWSDITEELMPMLAGSSSSQRWKRTGRPARCVSCGWR